VSHQDEFNTVKAEDLVADFQIDGEREDLVGDIPERVLVGGLDHRPVIEGQVDHRVFATVADQRRDRASTAFTSLRIGRQHQVADLHVRDGFRGAVSHLHRGARRESVPAILQKFRKSIVDFDQLVSCEYGWFPLSFLKVGERFFGNVYSVLPNIIGSIVSPIEHTV